VLKRGFLGFRFYTRGEFEKSVEREQQEQKDAAEEKVVKPKRL